MINPFRRNIKDEEITKKKLLKKLDLLKLLFISYTYHYFIFLCNQIMDSSRLSNLKFSINIPNDDLIIYPAFEELVLLYYIYFKRMNYTTAV